MCDNKFFIKDGIMYDNIYVFSKQYQCENTMWLLSVLTFTYRAMTDR